VPDRVQKEQKGTYSRYRIKFLLHMALLNIKRPGFSPHKINVDYVKYIIRTSSVYLSKQLLWAGLCNAKVFFLLR
jgi:hypothetical protein